MREVLVVFLHICMHVHCECPPRAWVCCDIICQQTIVFGMCMCRSFILEPSQIRPVCLEVEAMVVDLLTHVDRQNVANLKRWLWQGSQHVKQLPLYAVYSTFFLFPATIHSICTVTVIVTIVCINNLFECDKGDNGSIGAFIHVYAVLFHDSWLFLIICIPASLSAKGCVARAIPVVQIYCYRHSSTTNCSWRFVTMCRSVSKSWCGCTSRYESLMNWQRFRCIMRAFTGKGCQSRLCLLISGQCMQGTMQVIICGVLSLNACRPARFSEDDRNDGVLIANVGSATAIECTGGCAASMDIKSDLHDSITFSWNRLGCEKTCNAIAFCTKTTIGVCYFAGEVLFRSIRCIILMWMQKLVFGMYDATSSQ